MSSLAGNAFADGGSSGSAPFDSLADRGGGPGVMSFGVGTLLVRVLLLDPVEPVIVGGYAAPSEGEVYVGLDGGGDHLGGLPHGALPGDWGVDLVSWGVFTNVGPSICLLPTGGRRCWNPVIVLGWKPHDCRLAT